LTWHDRMGSASNKIVDVSAGAVVGARMNRTESRRLCDTRGQQASLAMRCDDRSQPGAGRVRRSAL
jgi:hypothetical protein